VGPQAQQTRGAGAAYRIVLHRPPIIPFQRGTSLIYYGELKPLLSLPDSAHRPRNFASHANFYTPGWPR
jgi:hypothetical protein